MTISWHGFSSFHIKDKDLNILIDPLDRKHYHLSSLSYEKPDICLLSAPKFFKYDQDALKSCPHVIKYPGEYEIKDVYIQANASTGPDHSENNIFFISYKSITIVHLGALRNKASLDKVLEKINGTDILLIPVGGGKVLDANQATAVIHQIEPKIVIPMFYNSKEKEKDSFGLEGVEYFVQQMGEKHEETNRLRINATEPVKEKNKIAILKLY